VAGKSQEVTDEDPRFLVAYLPLEFAAESKGDQERQAKEFLSKYGDRPRRYRNGLGLAIPDKKQIEALRRAVRYVLAIERVDAKKQQLRLTKDQLDQLKERKRTEEAAAESCFRDLYTAVWLPRVENGGIDVERVERGGRPLQAAGIHERIMELLTAVGTPRVHGSVTPRKIVERVKLGEPVAQGGQAVLGLKVSEIVESFFRDIAPPRLESSSVLRKAIARGVGEGTFAYTSGPQPALGADGKFQVSRDRLVVARPLAEDEVDFESGFLMVPVAVPDAAATPAPGILTLRPGTPAPPGTLPPPGGSGPVPASTPGAVDTARQGTVRLKFRATRDQIFKAFPAIANLADKSDDRKITVSVEGASTEGFDRSWLRNAVEEPLEEADIDKLPDDR
jgi:hypothetical protein